MSPMGSTGIRRGVHELDFPDSLWVTRLDQLVVLAGQPADLLEEGDVLLAAPDQRDVGQVTQRPLAGLAPDGAGRGHRLEDHRGGDPEAPQLGGELWAGRRAGRCWRTRRA